MALFNSFLYVYQRVCICAEECLTHTYPYQEVLLSPKRWLSMDHEAESPVKTNHQSAGISDYIGYVMGKWLEIHFLYGEATDIYNPSNSWRGNHWPWRRWWGSASGISLELLGWMSRIVAMDQYLSIFFRGWTSINPSYFGAEGVYFDVNRRIIWGFDPLWLFNDLLWKSPVWMDKSS